MILPSTNFAININTTDQDVHQANMEATIDKTAQIGNHQRDRSYSDANHDHALYLNSNTNPSHYNQSIDPTDMTIDVDSYSSANTSKEDNMSITGNNHSSRHRATASRILVLTIPMEMEYGDPNPARHRHVATLRRGNILLNTSSFLAIHHQHQVRSSMVAESAPS